MLYTAFIAGLIGSTHCIFMCGPIFKVTTASFSQNKVLQLYAALLYNIGRTATYILLGVVVGSLNYTLEWINITTYISMVIGILFIIKSLNLDHILISRKMFTRLNSKLFFLSKYFQQLLKSETKNPMRYLIIGYCNGFLPCGLVYALIGFCIVSNNISERVLIMVMFGLGTFFVFFVLALIPHHFLNKNKILYLYIQRIFIFLLGILFIYRGLYIEVPYLDQLLLDTSLQRIPLCD